ncbi:Protein ANTAGONIST OF LIKE HETEROCHROMATIN PROTEIN 1 [Frankliniella fusca]|uniref:Protein ANTAGONIST OF LIKE HETEROCHROMATIN PROTEIN 1 n=1 Tax=Frankliniella fusca TaxID=407009 RepID=A0AAE1GX19_9NEOP|nr:Protein ANTAGONIST OF LIKE HETEROCHROMATIN PROTEIN 1 [Frankliniella fusca]
MDPHVAPAAEEDDSSDSSGILNSESSSGDSDDIVLSMDDDDDAEDLDERAVQDPLFPVLALLLRGRRRERIENFIATVHAMSDYEFREHYRVTRQIFNVLLESLEESGRIPNHDGGREKKSAELCLLMTLWFLANKEVIRSLSNLFDMSYSSVHRIVRRVLDWLMDLMPQVITWPRGDEIQRVSLAFQEKAGIANIIGAIDGSHIEIQQPVGGGREYFNRKQHYSIVLQAVVDSDMKFTNVHCGDPGSFHDSRILRRSELYQVGQRDVQALFPNDTFLLGDKGYVGLGHQWIVTPFKDNGNLLPEQTDFNRRVSSTRVVVEQAFGIMKKRFAKLKKLEMRDMECMVRIVLACCTLHNICISNGDLGENLPDAPDDDDGLGFNGGGRGINGQAAVEEEDESDGEDEDEGDEVGGGLVAERMQHIIFRRMYPDAVLPARGRHRR